MLFGTPEFAIFLNKYRGFMTINAFKTFGIILLLGAVTANAATATIM